MKEIFEEVAKELSISPEQVKEIYEFKQRWIKERLKKNQYLQILDSGLGTYTLNYQKINRKIKNLNRRKYSGLIINPKILNKLYQLKDKLHNYNINRKRKQEKKDLCTV